MAEPIPREAILVLGMHRSGTSAIAGLLGSCGASLPAHLMSGGHNWHLNPRGFFESDLVFRAHEEMLADLGSSWDDLSPLPEGWSKSVVGRRYVERMAGIVETEYGDSPFIVLKDPRLCRLVPFWAEVMKSLVIELSFVLPVRNPLEVALSLQEAEGISLRNGLILWLDHFLQAEHDSRGYRRSFVSYEQVLTDWRSQVAKVSKDLKIQFPRMSRKAAAETDLFLDRNLRHQQIADSELKTRADVIGWVKDAYRWAEQATRNRSIPTAELDRLYGSLSRAEEAFGPMFADEVVAREQAEAEVGKLKEAFTQAEKEKEALETRLATRAPEADSLQALVAARDFQVQELVDCLKLMLVWIASHGPGRGSASEELKALLESLDSSSAESVSEMAKVGLQHYQESLLDFEATTGARDAEGQQVWRAEAAQFEERLSRYQEEISQAQNRLVQADDRAQLLRSELDERDQAYSELRSQLAGSSARTAELQGETEIQKMHAAQTVAQLEQQREATQALAGRLEARNGEVARLQQELQEIRQQFSAIGPAKEQVERQAKQLQERLSERTAALEAVTAEREQARARVNELDQAQAELQATSGQRNRLVSELRQRSEHLEAVLADVKDKLALVQAEAAKPGQEANRYEETIRELITQRQAATGEIQRLHGELSLLRKEVTGRSSDSSAV